ncbi:MAG: bifunctional phosphopantothenoylcysteine decarboxylase/phosphopantothenate--cysteine ligase CoaBC [Gammaproteobacteria bacterium]|nr:bifunctional phosphopantothenoylcysteine decarboxylase/phosphopantothenate--cysteine ligase CoaBC [Gammaproteobacteria bacterium]MBI5616366.1 bifunctional phosphopantothenoylcysteine decarboxylase/phosphopantothenate--cysteine ligase CoaBC [Gammaproteobacteria bacterium]
MSTSNKRLLVVVTGGIAAYKAPEIVRRARSRGAEVRVVMTPAACEFITPLTLQAVSGNPVHTELFDAAAEAAMGHIELARWADEVLVAPASADFLARLAHGLAGDLASTLCLATAAPLTVAPAMNRLMWDNAATRANVALLAARGVRMIGPEAGEQACGEVGPGRMSEPEAIVGALFDALPAGGLVGLRVLITAGPTQEPIDPVRFITNRSSGKMGYAVATAAAAAGARVTLVSGPTALAAPAGVDVRRVTTAAEMYEAVMAEVAAHDIFIASAAVADYRPEAPATQKMKKAGAALTLTLAPTQDILRAVAAREVPPFTVGFAAETEHVLENARSKLTGKSLDMIAANEVGAGMGFDSDENELHVIWQDGDTLLGRASKNSIARRLVELIAARYRAVRG